MDNAGLIVFDLDGTVLSQKTGDISERTIKALKGAREGGAALLAATGRPALLIPDRVMEIGPPLYIAASNGAVVLSCGGEELFRSVMDTGKVLSAMAASGGLGAALSAYCKEGVVAEKEVLLHLESGFDARGLRRAWVELMRSRAKIVDSVPVFLEKSAWSVEKFSYIQGGDYDWSEISALVSGYPGFLPLKVSENEIEITNRGVDKSLGISKAAERLNIKRENILAFGDGENDVCMRRTAGVLVAMGNSRRAMMECADFVTGTSDEDGVADFLERRAI